MTDIFFYGVIGGIAVLILNFTLSKLWNDDDKSQSDLKDFGGLLIIICALNTTKSIAALNIVHHKFPDLFGLMFGEGIPINNLLKFQL